MRRTCEFCITQQTRMFPFARMNSLMATQITGSSKRSPTNRTFERLLTRMGSLVIAKVRVLAKSLQNQVFMGGNL